jgi:hypothetical protein
MTFLIIGSLAVLIISVRLYVVRARADPYSLNPLRDEAFAAMEEGIAAGRQARTSQSHNPYHDGSDEPLPLRGTIAMPILTRWKVGARFSMSMVGCIGADIIGGCTAIDRQSLRPEPLRRAVVSGLREPLRRTDRRITWGRHFCASHGREVAGGSPRVRMIWYQHP